MVFLTALSIFVAVCGVLCYGIGKVLNARMNKEDGPNSKWTKTVDVRQLGNMPSSPELQNKMAESHAELPHAAGADRRRRSGRGRPACARGSAARQLQLGRSVEGHGRIPIERAMELIAQRGLPVAPAVQTAPPMTGDSTPKVAVPLTNGFARTAYEQEEAEQKLREG